MWASCQRPAHVADRVDVRDVRAHAAVGADARAGVELDAGGLQADALDAAGRGRWRPAPGRPRRCPRCRPPAWNVTAWPASCRRSIRGRPGAQVHGDAALLERPLELLGRVRVLHRDQPVEHLDDRHLAAPVGKIDANSTPITPPPRIASRSRHLLDREQAGRVDAAAGRRCRRPAVAATCDPVATIACLNLTSSPPSTASVFGVLVNVPRPVTTVMPLALTTPVMPLTSPPTMVSLFVWAVGKSSAAPSHRDADLGERLVRLLQRVRGLHPRLGRDAADGDARPADRGPARPAPRSRPAGLRGWRPGSRPARRPGRRHHTPSHHTPVVRLRRRGCYHRPFRPHPV